jgi:peptidoglycan hydrolase-like protein with peptidoglycan-binding domain
VLQSQPAIHEGLVIITRNYQIWDHGEDILALQKWLNDNGFIIAAAGPGSFGNETSIFGTNTYRALTKFQKANKLPATGYLGPLTRALINSQAH